MKEKDVFQYFLGALVVLGFFSLLGLLIFKGIPEKNAELLYLAVGALIGSFSTVVGYFYGSSAGSAAKNDLLRNGK